MEGYMQLAKPGDRSDEGALLPDLPGVPKKGRAHGNPQGHRNQPRAKKDDRFNRPEDDSSKRFDLIESTADGCLIFGKDRPKGNDRASVMIVLGLNDSSILDMGRLGMLKGRAQEIYEKFSR